MLVHPTDGGRMTPCAVSAYRWQDQLDRLLAEHHGFAVDAIDPAVQDRVITQQAAEAGLAVEAYLEQLTGRAGEVARLVRALFGVCEEPLDRQQIRGVVDRLVESKPRGPLRAWVIGCGSGTDTYQLALESLVRLDIEPEGLTVFATDLDEGVLAEAGWGHLSSEIVSTLSDEARVWLTPGDEGFVVKRSLRSRIAFAFHDLLRTPPFGKIDVLVCRHNLQYLTSDAKRHALDRLVFALKPGGLFLGSPELDLAKDGPYLEPLDPQLGLYRKQSGAPRARGILEATRSERLEISKRMRFLEQAVGASYSERGCLAAVVDHQGLLQAILAKGDGILQAPRGWNPGLLVHQLDTKVEGPLGRALAEAVETQQTVRRADVYTSNHSILELRVIPLEGTNLLLVELQKHKDEPSKLLPEDQRDRIRELQHELARVRSELEEALAVLVVGNNELAASNSELQAANEQLRDFNQELESRNRELELTNIHIDRRIEALEALGREADALFESAEVAAIFLGPDRTVWRYSPAVVDLAGVEPIRGEALTASAFGKDVLDAVELVMAGRGPVELERAIRGRHILIRVLARDLERTLGPGVVLTLTDLSKVWQANVAAEGQARQLAALFETADDPTVECSLAGHVAYANAAARDLLGMEGETGGNLVEALARVGATEPDGVREAIEAARHGLRRPRVTLSLPDSGRIFDVTARPMYIDGRVARVVVAARDVTELDASQREVHASQALMQAVLDSLKAAIAVVDPEGTVVRTNQAWRGSRAHSFPGAFAESGDSILDALAEEGTDAAGMVASYLRPILAGEGEPEVCRYPISHEGETRHLETMATRLSHAGRDLTVVVQHDVTSVKVAEQQRLEVQAKLLDADKLESLGLLAGGVAHDFNNLLVGILSNASFVLEQCKPGSLSSECLEDIELAAERAAELCQQLLAFSGRGQFQMRELQLDTIVQDSLRLLQASINRNITLEVLPPERSLPLIEADPSQLQQVLFNLVSNGAEAIADDTGTVRVTLGVEALDASRISRASHSDEAQVGRYVYLRVTDDGRGMDEDIRSRIFEPFFTTKFTGRGLGLAAVRGIVHGHGGVLEVDSAPNRGATVTAYFPASSSDLRREVLRHTVLIVDDEEMVRTAARRALAKAGFRVLEAASGAHAVRTFTAQQNRVDLVLLDVTMPGMSGEAVYLEIRRRRRSVPVLFSSGLPELADGHLLSGEDQTHFIQKPYRSTALVARVRSILDSSSVVTTQ